MMNRPQGAATLLPSACSSAAALRIMAVLLFLIVSSTASAQTIGGAIYQPVSHWGNWWKTDISWAPVDWNSWDYIGFINSPDSKRLHPSAGGDVWPGSVEIYSTPYITVNRWQSKKQVNFYYWWESDGAGIPFYPIPDEAILQPHWIEGGWPGVEDRRWSNDRHMLILDVDNNHLYELFNVYFDQWAWQWQAVSGAFFDLNTNNRRPEGWTSADAAGLAILPGLLRYDEVYGPNEIDHALRVTVRTTNGHVFPASHTAGWTWGALPMGARLRLRAEKDISYYPWEIQKIFRAMKRYGLIVADNGPDMMVGGTYDTRWNNDILNPAFHSLTAWDFEVIRLGWTP